MTEECTTCASLRSRITNLDTLIAREEGKAVAALSIAGRSLQRRNLEEMETQRGRLSVRLRMHQRVHAGADPYSIDTQRIRFRRPGV